MKFVDDFEYYYQSELQQKELLKHLNCMKTDLKAIEYEGLNRCKDSIFILRHSIMKKITTTVIIKML